MEKDKLEQDQITRLVHFRINHVNASQNKASKDLGITQSSLSYMENGERKISLKLLAALYDKYDMNPEWFLQGTGPEILKKAKPKNTIDVIGELRAEATVQNRKIQVLEANLNQAFRFIDEMQKQIKALTEK